MFYSPVYFVNFTHTVIAPRQSSHQIKHVLFLSLPAVYVAR